MTELIYKYWLQRYETCKRCTFSKSDLLDIVTCGTPVVGEIVTVGGKDIKLCGCIMKLKAKLESATCPLNLWENDNNTD
jgi:hypothetical protein